MAKKILFISNGHGEDTIAAGIMKYLGSSDITAMPLVGSGSPYNSTQATVIGSRQPMPSGGFVYQSLRGLVKDVYSGLVGNLVSDAKTLVQLKDQFDLTVAVGDIVPIIGALLVKNRFVFVGCAKSYYYRYNYTPWEKYLLKKYCSMCFARDQKTADRLAGHGIKCAYAGNPMMDCFEIKNIDFGLDKDTVRIGILPGTRDDALKNMEDILKAADEIDKTAISKNKKTAYLAAVSPLADISLFPKRSNLQIHSDRFGDIIDQSDIVIGLSGTGNEQAAGLGKPIVSFAGRGMQYTKSFAKRQTELLGHALKVADKDPKAVADAVWNILENGTLKQQMSSAGAGRMGSPGASQKIAEYIKNEDRA